jgi:glyoxylase-like metal-dependent hydrolase (beta-lactamase superfamily II)
MVPVIEPVVMDVHLPPGVAGPDPLDFDTRCFIVAHGSGVVLIDTCLAESSERIAAALERTGARWQDVTDVVLTHNHPDHTGGLPEVIRRVRTAAVWAGAADQGAVPFDGRLMTLTEGATVHGLRVLATPGHTAGHCSLIHEEASTLFAGDVAGTIAGAVTRGPVAFTADPEQAERSLRHLSTLSVERVLFSHGDEISNPIDSIRTLLGDPPAPDARIQ